MKQLSAFPDEKPDKEIKESPPPRFKGLRSRLESYLKKNGAYAFCKCVEALCASRSECKKFNVTTKEARQIGENIFGDATVYAETITSFLKKTKEIPGFKLIRLEQSK